MQIRILSVLSMLLALWLLASVNVLHAQASRAGVYSDEVILKADKYLDEVGLKRSGKSILSVDQATQLRNIASVSKRTVELKKAQQELDALTKLKKQLEANERLANKNLRDVSVRLTSPALTLRENQELVAMNNALIAQIEEYRSQGDDLKERLNAARSNMHAVESSYIGEVKKARDELELSKKSLMDRKSDKNIVMAFKVLATEFGTPAEIDEAIIFRTLENKLKDLEKGFHRDAVALIDDDGGTTKRIAVTVNDQSPIEMVLDTGASIVLLPKAAADKLNIVIPSDAPKAMMEVADGRAIPARIVFLDKVRVGNFEVKEVEAAILETESGSMEPLLGMSFLGNLQFQLKAAENELWLTQTKPDQGK